MKYKSDVKRMQNLLVKNGYSIKEKDVARIWSNYSDRYAAGWLYLPEYDSDLLDILVEFGDLEGQNEKRRKDLKELFKVFDEYGKKDIRLGQAISNAIKNEEVDLFTIENDKLLNLLKKGL